jgi:hypothetical protein
MKLLKFIDVRMMDRLHGNSQHPAYISLYRRQCDIMTQFYLSHGNAEE